MSEKVSVNELQNIVKSLFNNYTTKLTYLYKSKLLNDKVEIEGFGYKVDKRFNEVTKSTGFEVFEIIRDCIFPDTRDRISTKSCVINMNGIEIYAYIYEIKTILFKKLYRIVYEIWRNECCLQILVHDFGII